MSVNVPAPRAGTGRSDASRTGTTHVELYRVAEVMRLLSLSRSVIYNQIRAGRLRSVKEGKARLIPRTPSPTGAAPLE